MEDNVYFAVLKLFGSRGARFTTEDLAKELGTSKRTIYTYFLNKEDMIDKTIDFVFADIIKNDNLILENQMLTTEEKLKLLCGNTPDTYNISAIIRYREDLQKYYPESWKKLNLYLDNLWNSIIALSETEDNSTERINTVVLRLMLKETLKGLLDYEFAVKNQLSFEQGIKAMYDIILFGILKRKE